MNTLLRRPWTQIVCGDSIAVLRAMPSDCVDCVVTSPPYWGLRDYGVEGQIGLEPTLGEHIGRLVEVFEEVRRVLRPGGTCWVNYGDCYATAPNGRSAADTKTAGNDDRTFRDKPFSTVGGVLKPKDLCMVSNRLAIALQDAGWWVRSEIVWEKPNAMPESIRDRPAQSHEKIWMLSKSQRYWFDAEAVKQPAVSDHRSGNGYARPEQISRAGRGQKDDWNNIGGFRNLRNVWSIPTFPFPEAHYATFPPAIPDLCVRAGCPPRGTVLDPFFGAGTTGLAANRLGRNCIGIELKESDVEMASRRIAADGRGRMAYETR